MTVDEAGRFLTARNKDEYKTYMTGFIPGSARRGLPRNGSVAAHLKQSLLRTRQAASTFEFAYQARIAVERIRFAIRQTDQLAASQPVLKEVGMQLLDALERLETAERHFQECFRCDRSKLEQFNARGATSGVARNQFRRHKEHLFSLIFMTSSAQFPLLNPWEKNAREFRFIRGST